MLYCCPPERYVSQARCKQHRRRYSSLFRAVWYLPVRLSATAASIPIPPSHKIRIFFQIDSKTLPDVPDRATTFWSLLDNSAGNGDTISISPCSLTNGRPNFSQSWILCEKGIIQRGLTDTVRSEKPHILAGFGVPAR